MGRADSAFAETFRSETSQNEPDSFRKCKTTSDRHLKSRRVPAELDLNDQTSTLSTLRPALEKPPSTQRNSTEPRRRKSVTTTSSHSANSHRRRHGSAPSSRRTSCTVIDPSRPTRHYRISSSQTCPTLTRDLDDVLALHFRSCSLFPDPTYQPSLLGPTISTYDPSLGAEIGVTQGPLPLASAHGPDLPLVNEKPDAVTTSETQDTTMHWMSPSTRKSQYEKIDRANTGLRGLLRRVMPRCVSGPEPQRFYEEEKSDAGSVRRYRMDLSDVEDGDAKSTSDLKIQRRKVERTAAHRIEARETRFGCF